MKNLQKLFSMAMLGCMAAALFSCSKDEEENFDVEVGIVGEWEIESSEMLINGQSYDAYIEQAAQQAGMSADDFKDSFGATLDTEGNFHFMEDKKFTGTIEGDSMVGTWSANDKKLILEYGDGDDQEFIVKSLNSNKAILSIQDLEGITPELKIEILLHIERK